MNKKNQNKLFIVISLIAVFVVTKIMGGTTFIAMFLALSIPLLFILGKTVGKLRVFAIIIGLLLIGIDFFLLLLLVVPTQSYDIQTKNYYKEKENYMKIYVKDDPKDLNGMIIMKKEEDKKREKIDVKDYKKGEKIKLNENDKIYFVGRKSYKTYAVIYLWDDSIIRITPGTKLSLTKITKNLDNMLENQTNIKLEQGSIRFHVLKMIKDSSNMKIETGKGQTLIIRGTAGLVNVNENTNETNVISYNHFIEVVNNDKSHILKAGEGAIMKENSINIKDNVNDILKNISFDISLIEEFKIADKDYIENMKNEILNYIEEQVGNLKDFKAYNKLKEWKVKIFSIGDKDYKEYAKNLVNYKYLIGKSDKFTSKLTKNENLAFLASQLNKQKVKTAYLYDKVKKDIKNSDIYKTYIINLGIEGKVKDVNDSIKEDVKTIIERYGKDNEKLFEDIDYGIDSLINKYLNF